jgi:hypothetical protein
MLDSIAVIALATAAAKLGASRSRCAPDGGRGLCRTLAAGGALSVSVRQVGLRCPPVAVPAADGARPPVKRLTA